NAENLSAVLANLLRDKATRSVLLNMIRSLSEAQVSEMNAVTSELGDVMIAMQEQIGQAEQPIPARLMSDGTLRFLAIAAALLDLSQLNSGTDKANSGGRMLVVEEIESGLHPSQAAVLLNQLKESTKGGVQTLATTHSPAILDALDGADHSSVIVCSRGSDGWGKATTLTDFPDYFEVVGRSPLGTAAVRDQLRPGKSASKDSRSLVDVLGLR
ncbi:MAG: AAA family ATPase, partial [bacterium]|nr:AAA family ATPase [bacterium]